MTKLTIEEFDKYKRIYKTLPDQLVEFTNRVKLIQARSKKSWKRNNTNWILKQKMNQDLDDKLHSNFKCILNKIGKNNFKEVSQELLSLEIESEENLNNLVEQIFKKAVREDKYYEIYVKLSDLLFNKYVIDNDKKIFFRVVMLTKCQETFVSALSTEKEEDLKEIGLKTKLDLLGLVRFISGLYSNNLITDTIINNCLMTLVLKVQENKWYAIDCLCTMFEIIKTHIEKKTPEDYTKIINFLKTLTKNKEIRAKDRFKIMDILGV